VVYGNINICGLYIIYFINLERLLYNKISLNFLMDKALSNSIRNGFIGLVIVFLISFIFGGIYGEMIKDGGGVTAENIVWAFFGAILVSVPTGFILVFVISLIVYNFKNKKKEKSRTK